MANYLINSPSSEQVGTNTADLFDLEAIQGVSVFGVEGNDTFTADSIAAAASATRINAGKGRDTITLTGVSLENSQVFAGMGKDLIITDMNLTATTVRGGAGLDTIRISASVMSTATINGNDMADTISAGIGEASQGTFLGLGAGQDTLSAVFLSGAGAFTINGGLGHDSITVDQISADGVLSAFDVAGGGGKDTIEFGSTAAAALSGTSNINGGDLGDLMRFQGAIDMAIGSATIGGGAGADTIQFSAGVLLSAGFINAGAGLDSVYISGEFTDGSLNGGLGADTISLGTYAEDGSNGQIYGNEGVDKFNLGAVTFSGSVTTGGSILSYGAFDESNLSATDLVSAGITRAVATGTVKDNGNLFTLQTDVVDMSRATNVGNVTTFTGTDGIAVFTSTFATDLTARVTELDRVLTVGQTIAFRDGSGATDYVFVQGGASGSGVSNDLIVSTETAINGMTLASVSAMDIRFSATT